MALQQQLESEKQRVALMKRQQEQQEQFQAFEDMIRKKELENERLRILHQFSTDTSGADVREEPLIPGIEPPSFPQLPTNDSVLPQPPVVDRTLKPAGLHESCKYEMLHGTSLEGGVSLIKK